MSDPQAIRAARERLFALLDSDSEDRATMLSLLTPEEQKAFTYRWHTIPGQARVDPNRLPPPPFADPIMRRLLKSANEKLIQFEIDRLIEEEGL